MIVHLHGRLVPLDDARISPLDRGFLFGDGIYEGLRAFDGRIVRLDLHEKRLREGLAEVRLPWDTGPLAGICDTLLQANHLRDAFVYVQVTRGAPGPGQPVRSRVPPGTLTPTVFAYAVPAPRLAAYAEVPAKSAVTAEDTRWLRGHVKSISLMGGVVAALEAAERGADDAILLRRRDDGTRWATEGTSANLLIVPRGSTECVTPPLREAPILAGVTRDILLAASRAAGFPIVERPIPESELATASEVMLCGTLTMVTSIVSLDGRPVGDGSPGPAAARMLALLVRAIRSDSRT